MFGIGIGEFMLIMIVALLVVGPDKLPGIARSLAKTYNEFRRAGNEIKKSVREMNIDSAEEFIMGTVDRVVPGRADKNGPGRDDEDDGPGSTAETVPEWSSKRAAEPEIDHPEIEPKSQVSDSTEEPEPVLEPVSFEKPDRPVPSKDTLIAGAPVATDSEVPEKAPEMKSPKAASVAKKGSRGTKAATPARKKSTSERPSKKKSRLYRT